MTAMLKPRPYLLGTAPSLADFGMMGPMLRHFGQDPTPVEIMRNTAPAVYEWVARVWNARAAMGARLGGDRQPPLRRDPLRRMRALDRAPVRRLGDERRSLLGRRRVAARVVEVGDQGDRFELNRVEAPRAGVVADELHALLVGLGGFQLRRLPAKERRGAATNAGKREREKGPSVGKTLEVRIDGHHAKTLRS